MVTYRHASHICTSVIFLLLSFVYASQPSPGFRAIIEVADIAISAKNGSISEVHVPITVVRHASRHNTIKLSLFASPYEVNDNDLRYWKTLVYNTTLDADGKQNVSVSAIFSLLPNNTLDDIHIWANVENTGAVTLSIPNRHDGGVVICFDKESKSPRFIRPTALEDERNNVLHEQLAAQIADSRDSDQIMDVDMLESDDLPFDDYGYTSMHTAASELDEDNIFLLEGSATDDVPCARCLNAPPLTKVPCSSTVLVPPPPQSTLPCPMNQTEVQNRRSRRAVPNATYKLRFLFGSGAGEPIESLPVTIVAKVGGVTNKVRAVCNANGEITFAFRLSKGQKATISALYIEVTTLRWRVARSSNGETFKTAVINFTHATSISASAKISKTLKVQQKANNEVFQIAKTLRRLATFTKNSVSSLNHQQLTLWYPGDTESVSHFSTTDNNLPFISLELSDAADGDVLAHEYGHFVHWLARGKINYIGGGGSHSYCRASTRPGLAFQEGYATAFGLSALSSYKPQTKSIYCDDDDCFDFGDIRCSEYILDEPSSRFLSEQEVRVGAAIYDLFDSTNDGILQSTSDTELGRAGLGDRMRMKTQNMFWNVIKRDPTMNNIEQYW
jgi:hypothetical protein